MNTHTHTQALGVLSYFYIVRTGSTGTIHQYKAEPNERADPIQHCIFICDDVCGTNLHSNKWYQQVDTCPSDAWAKEELLYSGCYFGWDVHHVTLLSSLKSVQTQVNTLQYKIKHMVQV